MAKTTFSMSDDNLNEIASNEKKMKQLKGTASEASEEAKALKIFSYCHLIAGIAAVPLTEKSNLPSSVSAAIKGELTDFGGLTMSMAEKMLKNAVGARNVFGIGGSNITFEMVFDTFGQHQISSEAKLIKAVSGEAEKSKVQLAVEKVVGKRSTKKDSKGNRIASNKWLGGFTYDQIEEFHDLMADALRVRADMEAAAQAAADKAQAENEAVNAMTEQLKGQAA